MLPYIFKNFQQKLTLTPPCVNSLIMLSLSKFYIGFGCHQALLSSQQLFFVSWIFKIARSLLIFFEDWMSRIIESKFHAKKSWCAAEFEQWSLEVRILPSEYSSTELAGPSNLTNYHYNKTLNFARERLCEFGMKYPMMQNYFRECFGSIYLLICRK